MKQDEIRRILIDGVIRVIAKDGLDKVTTKQISIYTGVNEAYIYRYFKDKEDLLAKAFEALDDELSTRAMSYLDVMYKEDMTFENRAREYFFKVWDILLEDSDECIAYVRYYYSTYFMKYSATSHKSRFEPLVHKFERVFRDEAEVWMIVNHMMNVMLSFAIMVHNGHMPEDDDYAEHVFRVLYAAIKQYFRDGVIDG